jgi:hypothetical protein
MYYTVLRIYITMYLLSRERQAVHGPLFAVRSSQFAVRCSLFAVCSLSIVPR